MPPIPGESLQRLLDEAHQAWPQLSLPDDQLAHYLSERVATPDDGQRVRAGDLYLACACAAGDPKALELFDAACLGDVQRLMARVTPPGVSEEDVKQLVRQKLFVGDAPKIREYSGRGELRNWTRVVTTHLLLDLAGAAPADALEASTLALHESALADTDPELQYLKQHYRAEFKTAFEEAVATLSKRERNLLRHQLVFALSLQQIAAIYHVHRATAARWLESARHLLSARTRERLLARVQVSDGQLDSILRLIESQIDLSLKRILA